MKRFLSLMATAGLMLGGFAAIPGCENGRTSRSTYEVEGPGVERKVEVERHVDENESKVKIERHEETPQGTTDVEREYKIETDVDNR